MKCDYERAEQTLHRLEARMRSPESSRLFEAATNEQQPRLPLLVSCQLRANIEKQLDRLQEMESELKLLEKSLASLYVRKSDLDLNEPEQSMIQNRDLGLLNAKIAALVEQGQSMLASELRSRRILLNSLHDSVCLYEQRYKSELAWLQRINEATGTTTAKTQLEHGHSSMIGQLFSEMVARSSDLEGLNEIGVELTKLLKVSLPTFLGLDEI